ncbi:MAG: hypothetical protein K6T16_01740 [Candidatus Pacearchaeota archaeon]|nr:hypothetical protein [Candidatus Pacearchaeota archaeon]
MEKRIEERLPKINQFLIGLSILVGFVLFFILFLLVSLDPSSGFYEPSFFPIFIALLIFIGGIEGAIYWIKESVRIEEKKLEYKKESVWRNIAVAFRYIDLVRGIIGGVVFLAVLGVFFYFYITLTPLTKTITFSKTFFILLGSVLVWIIIRKPVLKGIGRLIKKVSYLPTYVLAEDGVVITLNIKNVADPSKKYIVKIGFDEIEELRELSYVEARTFLRYTMGPNVELAMRQAKDLYKYTKGEIERPSVWENVASDGKIVFIKGKDLFYLITFATNDVSDLIKAYNEFKAGKGKSEQKQSKTNKTKSFLPPPAPTAPPAPPAPLSPPKKR